VNKLVVGPIGHVFSADGAETGTASASAGHLQNGGGELVSRKFGVGGWANQIILIFFIKPMLMFLSA
jgi:hypothetical protein